MSSYIMYSDDLFHYGIKGQKWGVRRYEHSDGTLTEAGKKRYAKAIKTSQKELKKYSNVLGGAKIGAAIGAAVSSGLQTNGFRSLPSIKSYAEKKLEEVGNNGTIKLPDGRELFPVATPGLQGVANQPSILGLGNGSWPSNVDVNKISTGMEFVDKMIRVGATVESVANIVTKALPSAGIGFVAGAASVATYDLITNTRIKRARKFISEYEDAYKKTYGIGVNN